MVSFKYETFFLEHLLICCFLSAISGTLGDRFSLSVMGTSVVKAEEKVQAKRMSFAEMALALEVIQLSDSDSSFSVLAQPTVTDGPRQHVPLSDFVISLMSIFTHGL